MKICRICKQKKHQKHFIYHTKTSKRKTCYECNLEKERERGRRRRKDPEYKRKHYEYIKNRLETDSKFKERHKISSKKSRIKNKEKRKKTTKNYYLKVFNTLKSCSVCQKPIKGTKKKKYCDACRLERRKGNQHYKRVDPKNRPRGKSHPQWKGGVTFWRKQIWDSSKYKQWRKKCLQRDEYKCQWCGDHNYKGRGKSVILEVHHDPTFISLLERYKIKSKEDADVCNNLWLLKWGTTLCNECHNKTKKGRPKRRSVTNRAR